MAVVFLIFNNWKSLFACAAERERKMTLNVL